MLFAQLLNLWLQRLKFNWWYSWKAVWVSYRAKPHTPSSGGKSRERCDRITLQLKNWQLAKTATGSWLLLMLRAFPQLWKSKTQAAPQLVSHFSSRMAVMKLARTVGIPHRGCWGRAVAGSSIPASSPPPRQVLLEELNGNIFLYLGRGLWQKTHPWGKARNFQQKFP